MLKVGYNLTTIEAAMDRKLTHNEKLGYLLEQLKFMRSSNANFDQGSLDEAKRLALHARVLVHHTSQSKSLLHQLKLLPGMGVVNTALKSEPETAHRKIITQFPAKLLALRTTETGTVEYVPVLDQGPSRISLFPDWWNETVLLTPGKEFCRREVVLALANKLGGSHVEDGNLQADLISLLRNEPIGALVNVNDGPTQHVDKALEFTMRQISYELIASIERKLSKG